MRCFSLSLTLSSEVTFNCQSNEERYQWITKIESAIPNGSDSPQLHSKKGGDRVTQPSKLAVKEETTAPPAPSSAERQETVDEAALLATANHTEDGERERERERRGGVYNITTQMIALSCLISVYITTITITTNYYKSGFKRINFIFA